jgi:hypothetical protein
MFANGDTRILVHEDELRGCVTEKGGLLRDDLLTLGRHQPASRTVNRPRMERGVPTLCLVYPSSLNQRVLGSSPGAPTKVTIRTASACPVRMA